MNDDRLTQRPAQRMHAYGRAALLIEFTPEELTIDPMLPQRVAEVLRVEWGGNLSLGISILDAVPAEDVTLIRFTDAFDEKRLDRFAGLIDDVIATTASMRMTAKQESADVVIPVSYDGADLADVAHSCGMSVDHVIESHITTDFTVAFCGFSPGFAYLTDLPDALHLPRRRTPRTRVPTGSVAIAEHYCAVYPRESPGGWHLIGRTDQIMFDPDHAEPALLSPGTTVRFAPVTERIEVAINPAPANKALPPVNQPSAMTDPSSPPSARIEQTGVSCLIQDLGRPGWGHLAISESGAWDRRSHRLAQRLVGNPEDAAGLECVAGGLALQALDSITVAVTGAPGPVWIMRDGSANAMASHTPVYLAAGDELRIGMAASGLRRYVAIRGGIRTADTLGSRSTDTLSGLGPAAIKAGALVHLGRPHLPIPGADAAAPDPASTEAGVIPTANWSLLHPATREHLSTGAFHVSPASDRVGVRLTGPDARWLTDSQVTQRSRPMVRGAIQLPPDGQPVVFGPDHPATGGYPIIGVLADPDQPAQWAPGVTVRLREVVPFLLAPRAASSTGRAADS